MKWFIYKIAHLVNINVNHVVMSKFVSKYIWFDRDITKGWIYTDLFRQWMRSWRVDVTLELSLRGTMEGPVSASVTKVGITVKHTGSTV